MNQGQLKALLTRMAIHWPGWKGPDTPENLALTLSEYSQYLGDLDDSLVRSVLRSHALSGHPFPPTVGELRTGALAELSRTRKAGEGPQIALEASKASPGTRRAIELAIATQAANLEKHRHEAPKDGSSGAENCEVCLVHDHSDTRRAGHSVATSYNVHGVAYVTEEVVPMWWLTCPLCGWPEIEMAGWTTTALEWVKNQSTLSTT